MGYNSPCVSPLLQEVYLRAGVENKRAVRAMMAPARGGVLLDVGCADGSDAVALASAIRATTIVGLELADHFVEQARGRGIEVHQADISERWPVADGSVDALHSNQVIEHLSQTDHFMREIRRVLKLRRLREVVSTNNLASWHNIVALLVGLQPLPCHVSDEAVVGNPLALEETRYGPKIHRHLRIFHGPRARRSSRERTASRWTARSGRGTTRWAGRPRASWRESIRPTASISCSATGSRRPTQRRQREPRRPPLATVLCGRRLTLARAPRTRRPLQHLRISPVCASA